MGSRRDGTWILGLPGFRVVSMESDGEKADSRLTIRLEVECPTRHAPIGRKCRRPSGHECELHASRDQRAMDRGLLERCPAAGSAHPAAVKTLQLAFL